MSSRRSGQRRRFAGFLFSDFFWNKSAPFSDDSFLPSFCGAHHPQARSGLFPTGPVVARSARLFGFFFSFDARRPGSSDRLRPPMPGELANVAQTKPISNGAVLMGYLSEVLIPFAPALSLYHAAMVISPHSFWNTPSTTPVRFGGPHFRVNSPSACCCKKEGLAQRPFGPGSHVGRTFFCSELETV